MLRYAKTAKTRVFASVVGPMRVSTSVQLSTRGCCCSSSGRTSMVVVVAILIAVVTPAILMVVVVAVPMVIVICDTVKN